MTVAGFSAALRTAIERSGLSLNDISQRLRAHDTPVSVSALSYWQNGENRPERASSLAAVAALESILGQRPEALTSLLGPRRPRGRRPGPPLAYDQIWARPENVARVLSKVNAVPADLHTPHRLSQFVSYRVNAQGYEESMRVRRLIRADHDNTTRFLFVARCSALPHPPVITFTEGCRVARFRADVPSSTSVFEFLLDRPLAGGELATVEFALRFPPGQTSRHTQVTIHRPAREMVLHIAFDPAMLPRTCFGYFRPHSALPREHHRETTFDEHTTTHQFITLDPAPGQYGIEWSYS